MTRGGPCSVREPLVEDRVPLGEVSAMAKEGLARAGATLSKITVLDKRGEGE